MDFSGRIFYDFESFDVWRVYSTAIQAARDPRVRIDLAWEEFAGDDDPASPHTRALAACAAVREVHPVQHQRFVHAMLTLLFQEKDDPRKDTTLAVAARVAGIDGAEVIARAEEPGFSLLQESTAAARELGVVDVPTIVRTGPPVLIKTTGAAASGDAVGRLELIDLMLEDDGVWSLTKPSG